MKRMGRPSTTTVDLQGYSLEELKRLRHTYSNPYGRAILTAITMFCEGSAVKEIASFLMQTNVNIYIYINRWNTLGMAALESTKGKSSNSRITAEMEDDLISTVQHTKPNDFGLLGNVWTAQLLADYLYQNYEERCCQQTIRNLLHKRGFSFKRAQKKPSKGVKSEQDTFKKNGVDSQYCRKRF